MIIDAHQHVWDLTKAEYTWLTPDYGPIYRTIEMDEVKPSLARAGVVGTVLVQSADNAEDTANMLAVAADNPVVVGVVAYVPLDRPEDAAAQLEVLRRDPLVVGVRNLIHEIPDPDWLLRPEVDEGLGVLEAAGVPFDLVAVLPRHLELVPIISERHPRLNIVIDHLAKPPIGLADREPWWSLIAATAANPRVFGKVSGLYSATADPAAWTAEQVRPFLDHALDVFGPSRLMYGGDWPVSLIAGGYDRVWDGLSGLFAGLRPEERDQILGATAKAFYRLSEQRLASAAALIRE